jgi:hypothetical protein
VVFLLTGTMRSFVWFIRSVVPLNWWNPGLAGYFLAALLAELWFARSSSTPGTALVERRTQADYLSRPARLGPRVLAAAATAAAAVYSVLPTVANPQGLAEFLRSDRFISASTCRRTAMFVVGVVVAIELLQRVVVRRRQQHTSEVLIRADDSLRTWSIRILAGVSMVVTSGPVAWLIWMVGIRSGVVTVDWTWFIHGSVGLVVAVACFRRLSRPLAPWRVPRALRAQAA